MELGRALFARPFYVDECRLSELLNARNRNISARLSSWRCTIMRAELLNAHALSCSESRPILE